MCRDRYTGNTDCDNRRNAPIGKQDDVLRGSACPIPDVWILRRTHELPSLLPSYRPQPRALETDCVGGFRRRILRYLYQRGCLVFCAKAASQCHPLISVPPASRRKCWRRGSQSWGREWSLQTSAESAWPMDAHTRIRDLTSTI